jgi:tripartite-type tricarboxylate transporter receptor subunit TctC
MISFRLFVALVLLCSHSAVRADEFPNRQIRFIVGFPPGGSVDLLARAVANRVSKSIGRNVLVENHAGASTSVSAELVAKARPDGYTVLVASDSLAINKSLFKNLPFDPITSFAPVTLAITSPQILVVRPNLDIRTPEKYVAKIRAAPGTINIAITGVGTIGHLASELVNLSLGGLRVNYVPYSGGGPAIRDLTGGHVDGLYTTLPSVTGLVRGGGVIPVAVTSSKRSPALPDVPTFYETVAPNLVIDSWQGFLVPFGTPKTVIDVLNREIAAALRDDSVAMPLTDLGYNIVAGPPDVFTDLLKADVDRFRDIVQSAGIRVE